MIFIKLMLFNIICKNEKDKSFKFKEPCVCLWYTQCNKICLLLLIALDI
jgi:hypothetical protein